MSAASSQPVPATALAAFVVAAEANHAGMSAAAEMATRVADSAEASIGIARAAQRDARTVGEQQAADVMLQDALALLRVALAAQDALVGQLAEAEQRRHRALAGLWQDGAPAGADAGGRPCRQ